MKTSFVWHVTVLAMSREMVLLDHEAIPYCNCSGCQWVGETDGQASVGLWC